MGDTVLCVRRVLLILILCQQSHSSCEIVYKGLCLEKTLKTWTEASESCNLVVSNTSLNIGVPIRDIPVLEHISSAPTYNSEGLYWIGATGKFTPWFELIGCYLYFYPSSSQKLTFGSNIGPVAECYQICENRNVIYKEFGINETHCFCRKDETGSIKNQRCKLQQHTKNFMKDLIGTSRVVGTGKFHGFAMYRKSVITNIDDTFGECLLQTNEGNKTFSCDSADITKLSWAERHREELNNNSLPRWTSYVRRLILSWKKGTTAVQDGTVCIGVRNQNGYYEPLPRRCNETHTSICQNAAITTDTTTALTTNSDSRTSRGRTTSVHQVTDTTVPHTTNSDLRIWRGPTTSVHQITDSTDSTLPLIIGSVAESGK